MLHHDYKFGIKGNLKVLICKMFGHRINDNPAHHWCGRCGLAYEECYHPLNYYEQSGIIDVSQYDADGNLK